MAINIKPILEAGLATQSASLLFDDFKMLKKKKFKNKDILRSGVRKIVGISLIRTQAQLINEI